MGCENQMDEECQNTVADGCPAFADGCPYGKSVEVAEWIKEKREEALGACPAFKDGCPFNETGDLAGLQSKLEALPPSHGKAQDAEGKPHAVLVDMLKTVHKASQTVKQTVGECPVFQEACPFKNCCTSSGTPLALELETRSWGLWIEAQPEDGLAKKLKEGTMEAHKAAESVHFVKEFIKCRVDQQIYAQFVVNLFHIYQALEDALEANQEHPLVESLHFPEELERAAALKLDAEFYLGRNWEQETLPSKTTREYVQRLRQLQDEAPELLLPHAYTRLTISVKLIHFSSVKRVIHQRYLGDLSGGQLLKKAAIRGMKLPADGSGGSARQFSNMPPQVDRLGPPPHCSC
ncbi:Heme oxygenase 2 (HO-2) [Durusdinium trenchii]|uniref:Heme oxygenase 2 (HO-2) n=1 Tax=Durusdinium trenchii TaxID=1381693 RepID=A0ABP0Q233_9DINO